MLLSDDELRPFQKHSTQMAALDYLVSVASDVFIPSNDGNMAKVVEGHRRSEYTVSFLAFNCLFLPDVPSSSSIIATWLIQQEAHNVQFTYHGNKTSNINASRLDDKCLCCECRFTGFHKTIQLDRKKLVELIDLFEDQELSWEEFSVGVKELHMGRMSQPTRRRVIPGQPKEEDYFYANPHECLGPARKRMERLKHIEI